MSVQIERQARIGMSGNEAVAYAVKQSNVDVVAAYPITPQTIIVERIAEYVNNGELDAAYIAVESEHSALSSCIGASLAGARVFTATASQGLALMWEVLWIASAMRTPIVMALANRALSAPINIHCSHDDAYAVRDAGWIQLFAENVQEAYDLTIQAFKIAEDERVLLPTIVNLDGFILSHSVESLYVLNDESVRAFLPSRKLVNPINIRNPMTYGPLVLYDYYMEFKRAQAEAFNNSYPTILNILREYSRLSGRNYEPIKTYGMEDAEAALVILGSSAGTARFVARKLRGEGKKVGVVSLTLYRPFPRDELAKVLRNVKSVVVMDRSYSFGSPGAPLLMDVASALYDEKERPLLINAVYGLGGRDFTADQAETAFCIALETTRSGEVKERQIWLGVR
ncbi:MAG: transketolase C-terminal domain-containing protein [Thermofilaceae archaeon]